MYLICAFTEVLQMYSVCMSDPGKHHGSSALVGEAIDYSKSKMTPATAATTNLWYLAAHL